MPHGIDSARDWPPIIHGSGVLRKASEEWTRPVILTTRSPLRAVATILASPPLSVIVVEGNDRKLLDQYAREAAAFHTVVGVGSGLVMDAAKYVARQNGQVLVQVPSSASNNACFTRTAWAMDGGRRIAERDCPVPHAIIADTALIAAAPPSFNRAGLAEILCSHTAVFDWALGHKAGLDVDWDQTLLAFALNELEAVPQMIPAVAHGEPDAFVGIIRACARFAPWFSSHPKARFNAGSEHLFAWALDATAGRRMIHGEAVALGILLMALLQGNDPDSPARLIVDARLPFHPDHIGASWDLVADTLVALPDYARTMPWFTIIDTLGDPALAAQKLSDFLPGARRFVDGLKA
ncbi:MULTISPECIES: iron-containing alcohol dehydrogenase [unclassified Chelatococcus]|uniref:iron-containing alcohol dehydrogenase n=1 Tax=unclassified Chelatococcus TaxID=2638111 RepID=UPI0025B84BBE|nr:iron-containing alcohol dehydrogenase [Chelatococcus sp.]